MHRHSFLKWAAVVSGFIMVALAGYLYKQDQRIQVTAAYGQVKEITLPDLSTVILNGNSTLSYKISKRNSAREVWLTGEAFFKVTHQQNHQKFVVHLSDKVAIEVLGTEFNVQERSGKREVVLKTGKVKLDVNQKFKKFRVFLRPGELVEVQEKNELPQITRKEMVNPEQYCAWTNQKWILDATTLQEMLEKIKETYGIKAAVRNKALLQRKASGTLPLPNNQADLLLQDIALLFDLTVEQQGDLIYLVGKKQK